MADPTVPAYLDSIARSLEVLAGLESHSRDETIEGRLQRIAASLPGALSSTGSTADLTMDDLLDVEAPTPVARNLLIHDGDTWNEDVLVTADVPNLGILNDLSKGWDGSIIESPDIEVTSDGAVISLAVEATGGGDLTARFGGENYTFDATPAATVALTAGTDIAPTQNWIYLEEAAGVVTMVANTSGWPATPFCAIATVICQSAASLQTDGAYKVHAWTDHVNKETENGHVSHLSRKIRREHATWDADIAPADMAVSSPDAYLSVGSGTVYQLHNHTFPALDMQAGDPVYVANDPAAAYTKITTLDSISQDAAGGTINNRYFSLVLWGSVNEKEADCKLFLNLPTGTYSTATQANDDLNSYTVFDMPDSFRGTGFLIARYVVQGKNSGTWTQENKIDLRGTTPSSSPGGSVGATVLNDLADVTIGTAVSGNFLRFNGSTWIPLTPRIAFDIAGVFSTGASDQVLVSVGSGSYADTEYKISALADVLITSLSSGETIQWNGSAWVNVAFPAGDHGGLTGLGDDDHTQYLLADGTRALTGDWDAGDFLIESETLKVENLTGDVSIDVATLVNNYTETGSFSSRVYNALNIDVDHTYNFAGIDNSITRLINGTLDCTVSVGVASLASPQLLKLVGTGDATTGWGATAATAPVYLSVTNAKTTQTMQNGAFHFALAMGASSGFGISTRSYVSGSGSGDLLAYSGYVDGLVGYTGGATGVEGFIVTRTGMTSIIGLSGKPKGITSGGLPNNDVIMSVRGQSGHIMADQGSVIATGTVRGTPSSASPTHLNFSNLAGDMYAEGDLEIDGTAFFDGDIDHSGSNLGFYGTSPAAQPPAYTLTNVTTDRTIDANSTSEAELADVLCTLIQDLQSIGLLQ